MQRHTLQQRIFIVLTALVTFFAGICAGTRPEVSGCEDADDPGARLAACRDSPTKRDRPIRGACWAPEIIDTWRFLYDE